MCRRSLLLYLSVPIMIIQSVSWLKFWVAHFVCLLLSQFLELDTTCSKNKKMVYYYTCAVTLSVHYYHVGQYRLMPSTTRFVVSSLASSLRHHWSYSVLLLRCICTPDKFTVSTQWYSVNIQLNALLQPVALLRLPQLIPATSIIVLNVLPGTPKCVCVCVFVKLLYIPFHFTRIFCTCKDNNKIWDINACTIHNFYKQHHIHTWVTVQHRLATVFPCMIIYNWVIHMQEESILIALVEVISCLQCMQRICQHYWLYIIP